MTDNMDNNNRIYGGTVAIRKVEELDPSRGQSANVYIDADGREFPVGRIKNSRDIEDFHSTVLMQGANGDGILYLVESDFEDYSASY